MFHLSDLPSGKLYRRMNFLRIRQELAKLINERDYDGLSLRSPDIVTCVEFEIAEEYEHPESYLIYWIAECSDHAAGRLMFQIFKNACGEHSHYHWTEIMRASGKSMMIGAVMSENIKLLEHAMCHVDEIELERTLYDIHLPVVEKWYERNFVVT
ncbi:MAG: hypothetical protein CMA72_07840 [Euryarchaeota archaeon]|nr:hypothetical protein [Euryarchaeota archaeon]